jgi:O-antigen/teichoic acid export membrane protein
MVGSGLNFLANVLLARYLGPLEFGIFTLAVAWLYILVILARLGFDQSPTPIIAAMRGRHDRNSVRPFMRFSLKWVTLISVAVAALGVGIMHFASSWVPDGIEAVVPFVLAAIPTLAIAQFMESTFRGLGRVQFAWIPMSLLQPAALLAFVFIGIEWLRLPPSGYLATVAFVLSLVLSLAVLAFEWFREFSHLPGHAVGRTQETAWFKISASMIVGGSFSVLVNQTTTVLTGVSETMDAGLFGAATRLANIVGLMTGTLFGVVGNRLAEVHARGDTAEFRHLLVLAFGIIAAVAIPAFLVGAAFPTELLRIMGAEFTPAANCLVLLLAYQAALALANLATLALNMIGQHIYIARLLGVHIVANFVLSWLFIDRAGINGAAAALLVVALSIGVFAWYQLARTLRVGRTDASRTQS